VTASPGARLIDGATGHLLEGARLSARIDRVAAELADLPPGAVFTLTEPTTAAALRFLGAWTARRPVLPLDPSSPDSVLDDLLTRFLPAVLIGLSEGHLARLGNRTGYRATALPTLGPGLVREIASPSQPHPDLAVLLSTSGSTGQPKLVRLSRSGFLANAEAIAGALAIGPESVAATTLPLFYSYGLSVLTSHLRAGATIVLTDGDVTGRALWSAVDAHGVTTLALVPSQFEMLRRMRWRPEGHARIRSMTAAGGRLRDDTAAYFHSGLSTCGGRLFVMYGQTEAGPRISVLPPELLGEKLGSVGPGIAGVRLSIRLADGTETVEPGLSGEVICSGPSVMMGYANDAHKLAEPDELHGTLRTGDLGRLDEDGCLWLSGRTSRIGKVFGIRVDLDAVERTLTAEGPVAAVAVEDTIRIWVEGAGGREPELARDVADRLRVPHSGVEVRSLDLLPTLSNGKTDYRALEAR
jgi:acyl-CoA synthetase (AMP-forming)/AMP-acid ligase II